MATLPPTVTRATPPAPPAGGRGSAPQTDLSSETGLWRSRARRDQLLAVVIGVVLLAVAMLIQPLLASRRSTMVEEPAASLKSLAINFPRLTLGGFRGLLATYLWDQAENDKEEHKWMDLETKYDIIGALEPYFVTVYVFHSWNQAYNLSAQWHDQDSKYKWILDGLAYLYKGEEYNPDNPDLILEEGNLYFLKLGGAFERIFFRAHWRSDIARMYQLETIDPSDKTDQTEALKLVREFVLRKEFHTTEMWNGSRSARGYGVEIVDPWLFKDRKDGHAPSDPMDFRYGLSTFYFGYIEYKRSLGAGPVTTIGENVADGWPGMSLRMWCRDDLYYAYQTMDDMFDQNDEKVLNTPAAYNAKVAEIRDCYRNVDMIAPRAVDELNRDMGIFPGNRSVHLKHVDETNSYRAIGAAESKLFNALVIWQNADRKLTPEVKQALLAALPEYDKAISVTYSWVDKMYPVLENRQTGEKFVNPDRADFERYVNALKTRKAGIQNMLNTAPNVKPDMSFLREKVVER